MRYLAIDPGNVTGVAYYNSRTPKVPPLTYEIGDGLKGFVQWWDNSAEPEFAQQAFVEDFIVRPDTHKKTRQPAAYEILGYVKGKCLEEDLPCMVIGPSEHTPFSEYKKRKKSKIVRLGWSVPSKDMHADSASSILLLGLVRTNFAAISPLLLEISNE